MHHLLPIHILNRTTHEIFLDICVFMQILTVGKYLQDINEFKANGFEDSLCVIAERYSSCNIK